MRTLGPALSGHERHRFGVARERAFLDPKSVQSSRHRRPWRSWTMGMPRSRPLPDMHMHHTLSWWRCGLASQMKSPSCKKLNNGSIRSMWKREKWRSQCKPNRKQRSWNLGTTMTSGQSHATSRGIFQRAFQMHYPRSKFRTGLRSIRG